MEATSARMAQRYQFDGFPPPKSSLQRYIYNACDPVNNFEPNLALNLEIVDMINSKKGTAPRDAAVTIVQIINHRNPNVSLLALSLLDICVKNCGYPFHLQISTKEFLNELVRRFPERPPLRASKVQTKVLEAIEEWRQTICQTSKYKEDLGFIRDMHRLLLYKGYMFPEVRREDAAVLNHNEGLQSAEEMEEEEKAAQSAKLQELIRRGTPQDLQEANRLMKIMAGYDTRSKTDYRAKAAEEVAKVQQKAKILEEMLQNQREGDKMEEGDAFEELASALQSAHPKIQKMCEEESDDAEAVAKLLEINDSIHRTIERYKLMKAGNVTAANNIPKGTLGTTTGVGKNAANELSLIDFDPEAPAAPTTSSSNGGLIDGSLDGSSSKQTTVEDDLLGLSLGGGSAPSTGGISLDGAALSNLYSQPTTTSPPPSFPPAQPRPFNSPQPSQSTKPNYNAFASLGTPMTSRQATPSLSQQKTTPSADPFAALVSAGSRPATPSQQQNGTKSGSSSQQHTSNLLDISSSSQAPSASISNNNDDEWEFSSALPPSSEPALPSSATLQIHSSPNINVEFTSQRRSPPNNNSILINANFSNTSPIQAISQLHFQVAVEKAYSIQLNPQTGRDIAPGAERTVKQDILLSNIPLGKGTEVKMRYKVGYVVGGAQKEESGMVSGLGIA